MLLYKNTDVATKEHWCCFQRTLMLLPKNTDVATKEHWCCYIRTLMLLQKNTDVAIKEHWCCYKRTLMLLQKNTDVATKNNIESQAIMIITDNICNDVILTKWQDKYCFCSRFCLIWMRQQKIQRFRFFFCVIHFFVSWDDMRFYEKNVFCFYFIRKVNQYDFIIFLFYWNQKIFLFLFSKCLYVIYNVATISIWNDPTFCAFYLIKMTKIAHKLIATTCNILCTKRNFVW